MFYQKEEELASDTPSSNLVSNTTRVATPEVASDTFEVCSDCNCKNSDLQTNIEQQQQQQSSPEECLQIKKEPIGSSQEYELDQNFERQEEISKAKSDMIDLNEGEIRKQFAFKRMLNDKGKVEIMMRF